VKRGSYEDASFLQSAFNNQDAVLFALSVKATDHQAKLIEAAARANVKWILPNEYAGDGMNESMVDGSPLFQPKREARKLIEKLAQRYTGLSWIAVATNPWVENSIHFGLLGLNPTEKTAKIATDSGNFNLSTLNRVGEGISRLLSLPVTNPEHPRASLQHYANNFLYLSSFSTSQWEAFKSVQRATGTTEEEWKIESDNIAERIRKDKDLMATGGEGAFHAVYDLLCAYYIGKGLGGDYQSKAVEDLKVLGLAEEDQNEVIKRVIETGPPKLPF
jgi:hypothetical protein